MRVLSNKTLLVQSIMTYSHRHNSQLSSQSELQSELNIMDLKQSTNETNKNNSTILNDI